MSPRFETTSLPTKVRHIYQDTVAAYQARADLLAGAGLRAVVESLCLEYGVKGTLEKKIDLLEQKQIITKLQASCLHEAREFGNEAVHEIEPPSEQELRGLFEIVHSILHAVYVLPHRQQGLEKSRTAKKKSKGTSAPSTGSGMIAP